MTIRIVKRTNIDDTKWDACVSASANGNTFTYTWYIDLVCDNWEGLVLNDYEAVMPLPIKRLLGVQLVYRPSLMPYSGVINQVPIDSETIWQMLRRIPYFNSEIVLNAHNKLPIRQKRRCSSYRYLVLDLISDIGRIERHFSKDVLAVSRMYREKRLTVVRDLNVGDYMRFVKETNADLELEPNRLQQMMAYALRYKSAGMYAAYDERNRIIAGAFLLKSNGSLSLMHCVAKDKALSGVKAIIYHILKNNAGANLILEFPYCSDELGSCFSTDQHVCIEYKKGLSKWIDL